MACGLVVLTYPIWLAIGLVALIWTLIGKFNIFVFYIILQELTGDFLCLSFFIFCRFKVRWSKRTSVLHEDIPGNFGWGCTAETLGPLSLLPDNAERHFATLYWTRHQANQLFSLIDTLFETQIFWFLFYNPNLTSLKTSPFIGAVYNPYTLHPSFHPLPTPLTPLEFYHDTSFQPYRLSHHS